MLLTDFAELIVETVQQELKLASSGAASPNEVAQKETAILALCERLWLDFCRRAHVEASDEIRALPYVLWTAHNESRHISDNWLKMRFIARLRRQGYSLQDAFEKIANSWSDVDDSGLSVEAVKKTYQRVKSRADSFDRFDYQIDRETLVVRAIDFFDWLPSHAGRPATLAGQPN